MRRRLLPLLLLALLLLPGCTGQSPEETGYDVYFLSKSGGEAALDAEVRTLQPEEDPVEGLLGLLLAGPEGENLRRTIPEGVTLRSWTLENGLLTVDLSGRYGSLSGVALTLADYSVVLTLTQVEGVEAVTVTAEGEQIPYRDHQRLTARDVQTQLPPEEE